MPDEMAGMWIGASTHEVAQVVAAGGTVSGAALAVAVTVKLARVITLAPIIAVLQCSCGAGTQPGAAKPLSCRCSSQVSLWPCLFARRVSSTRLPFGYGNCPNNFASGMCLPWGLVHPFAIQVGAKPVVLGVISTSIILVVSLGGSLLFSWSWITNWRVSTEFT